MTLSLTIDRPLVPALAPSERHLLVRIQAPAAPSNAPREPISVAFVIDRSGSMRGAPLELACQAVAEAIPLLEPSDQVAVVLYESDVEVLHPLGPADERSTAPLLEALLDVECGSMTNLSGGWLTGCEQVAPTVNQANARVLLLTDGLANRGITEVPELSLHAQELRTRGITTTTLGLGDGFEEELLQELAPRGGGASYYLRDETEIPTFVEAELKEALSVVIPDARLNIRCTHPLSMELISRYPTSEHGEGLEVHLGDLVDEQELVLAMRLEVPDLASETSVRIKVTLGSGAMASGSEDREQDDRPLVLVIDDNKDARTILEHTLEEGGYRVVTASSGRSGLRMAQILQPDVVLLDLLMPEMNGHEVLDVFNDAPGLQHIPVIVVSFVASESRRHLEGAAAMIDKPASAEELKEVICQHVNEGTRQDTGGDERRRIRSFLGDPSETQAEVALTIAPEDACNVQQGDMDVAREVASLYAARTRLDALQLNRIGDLEEAARILKVMASTIELGQAGEDPQIRALVRALRKDATRYGRWMSDSDRKHHSQVSYTRVRSRRADGTSIRLLET